MLAKMIDKIVSLKETKTFEIGGQTYTDGHLTRIPPHVDRPEAISVSGLDGVCKLIRGGIKDTVETIHRDPDGFFKGGARRKTTRPSPARRSTSNPGPPAIWARPT